MSAVPLPGGVVSPANDPPLSWAQTRAHIRADFARVIDAMGGDARWSRCAFWWWLPGFQALLWHRIGRHLYLRGWRQTAWLLYLVSSYCTRIEIVPTTALGPGCYIGHAPAVLSGRIGAHFTLHGDGGTGGGMAEGDIGGGPDLPVVGDDVVFAIRAMALGPIRIGNGARLGPGAVATRDVPPGALLVAAPARLVPSAQAPASSAASAP